MKVMDIEFAVVANVEVALGIHHLELASLNGVSINALPGQFAMVRVARSDDPLLRRPLSFLAAEGDRMEFLYRVVGRGTELLARKGKGDSVDVLGPLGRPFNAVAAGEKALLVGGGMGVAPLHFLARNLSARGVDVGFVYGACNANELFRIENLRECCVSVSIATDDGSAGEKCFASELGASVMKDMRPEIVYACGPGPMLEAVAKSAKSHGVRCQVSLESRMACGVGACMGCSMSVPGGSVRVCKDGPVFDAGEIFP